MKPDFTFLLTPNKNHPQLPKETVVFDVAFPPPLLKKREF